MGTLLWLSIAEEMVEHETQEVMPWLNSMKHGDITIRREEDGSYLIGQQEVSGPITWGFKLSPGDSLDIPIGGSYVYILLTGETTAWLVWARLYRETVGRWKRLQHIWRIWTA